MELSILTDRLKNLPTRHKQYVFFMHIPKTGGTSVISSLKKNYPFNFFKINAGSSLKAAKKLYGEQYQSFEQCYRLRQNVAAYAIESEFKCVAGHVPYSRNLFESPEKKYLFFTILRDPVQRYISKYFFNYHKSGEHCRYEMSFPEYLDSETGKESGCEYLRYLSDSYTPGEQPDRQMVEKSKENILKLDVVGFLDNMDKFAADFYQKTNVKLRIPHKNRTRELTENKSVDPSIINRINEVCKYDIEIYEHAKKHFH